MLRSISMDAYFVILLVFQMLFSQAQVEDLADRLHHFDDEYQLMWWLHQSADWSYSTNMTATTALARSYASAARSHWMRGWQLWARGCDNEALTLPLHQRQALQTMASGVVVTHPEEASQIAELKSRLTENYSSVKITVSNMTAAGESQVMQLVSQLRDPDVLKDVWKSWRLQVSENTKETYLQLIQVTNKAAQENGYSDIGETWREELGLNDVIGTVLTLWNEVKDFYQELQVYTKNKLRSLYGEKHLGVGEWIPAHLLGSLWGENWVALSDILIPYPENTFINMTSSFLSKKYSVHDLLRKAEEFYTTMGFDIMKRKFWTNSMFVKPKDKHHLVDCHAVSYDFALNNDFRVRMCAEVNEKSFLEIIHEMGHIHYYMAYHKLPIMMRSGANSAFHEAVGETMVYAAQSPQCLQKLDIQSFKLSKELVINTLMKQALSKFVLLPWALTVEMWRYNLFSGKINKKDMISKWWELRKKYQGVEPPDYDSSLLFDPASKYHVALNIPYMRYFLSRFLEHQFLEALCNIAGDNVHDCCFITSLEAGSHLKYMLSLGASVTWQDALQILTGQRHLSSKPIMNYYKPLHDWLIEYNRANNISKTW